MTESLLTPFYALRRWEAASVGLASFLAYLLFVYLLGEGRGTVAGAFLGTFGFTVRASWPLRNEVWFWIAIVLLATLHVFAVAAFKWSSAAHWTGLTLMPFMAADLALLLASVFVIYRWIYGAPARLFTWPPPRYADDIE